MTEPVSQKARAAVVAVGPPIFGVADWSGERAVSGWGHSSGAGSRVTLRHLRSELEVVEVETHQAPEPTAGRRQEFLQLHQWFFARFGADERADLPVTLELRRDVIDIDVNGEPSAFRLVSDGTVWVAEGMSDGRLVWITGRGISPATVALATVDAETDRYLPAGA